MKLSEIRAKFPQYQDIPSDQLLMAIHQKYYPDIPAGKFYQGVEYDTEKIDPTADMSMGQKLAAGAGKAMTDAWQGLKQVVGSADSEDVKEKRRLDAGLMNTGAGKVGNFAGNVGIFAPTALIPGANTITGAGIIGAASGLIAPAESGTERLVNALVGGGAGVGGQYLGNKAREVLSSKLRASKEAADLANALRAPKNEVLKAGQEAGYVIPPSAVNPSWINKRLESIAGKAAIGQEASLRNQDVTNALARKALGIADDVPVTTGALENVRNAAAGPYKEVSNLSDIAAQDLEALKQARFDTNAQFKFYNRSADPSALAKAKEGRELVNALEESLQNEAKAASRPELIEALSGARKQIAKSYDVERAANGATGDVSAPVIGRLLEKGRPLTEELQTIGNMQQAFPSYMREGAKIPTPGVSAVEAGSVPLLSGLGAAATGDLSGVLLGGAPLLRSPVRSMILSNPYQKLMAKTPQEVPAATLRLAEALAKSNITKAVTPALSAQGVLLAPSMSE